MNLLFCISQNYLGAFLCCIKSITMYGGSEHYDIYLMHSFMDQKMMDALSWDFRNVFTFHFIQISKERFDSFSPNSRYPTEIYYQLVAPLYLPEDLTRILYLDADTLVINPLNELYETAFDDNFYVGCTHSQKHFSKSHRVRHPKNKDAAYINTGVLLMNLPALRQNMCMEDIRSYISRSNHSLFFSERNALSELYQNKIKLVDTIRYNLCEKVLTLYNADHKHEEIDLHWIRHNSVIIHYCGKVKPWNNNYIGILDVFYKELMASK